MTERNMIELIRVLHPEAGETEIRLMLNQAQEEFVTRIGDLITETDTFNTVSGTMYYSFSGMSNISADDDLIAIKRVDYDGSPIQRLVGAETMKGA